MKKENKIILAIVISIIAIAIATTTIVKETNKKNLEQQELDIKKAEIEYQKEQDRQKRVDELYMEIKLNDCLDQAEDNYWTYAELNGTGDRYEGVNMAQYKWDTANKKKQQEIENCYKRFNK